MEHGSYEDQTQATFSLSDEDHTLANSLRFVLNQDFQMWLDKPGIAELCLFALCFKVLAVVINVLELCFCSPRVSVCGYSIPHPSDARVNIRVQTTGDPASEVVKDSCQDLMLMCQHVRSTFDQAFTKFKSENES
ncbi:hypothetical protein Leryth_013296 [Lithospermum erythrorhizon]|nr:hypothetical protein Leryth_013296 [Lithospermum erythrorhizon]